MTRGRPGPLHRGRRAGAGNANSKLTDADVLEIRRLRGGTGVCLPATDPGNIKVLAERFGVTRSHISKVARGLMWTHYLATPPKSQGAEPSDKS